MGKRYRAAQRLHFVRVGNCHLTNVRSRNIYISVSGNSLNKEVDDIGVGADLESDEEQAGSGQLKVLQGEIIAVISSEEYGSCITWVDEVAFLSLSDSAHVFLQSSHLSDSSLLLLSLRHETSSSGALILPPLRWIHTAYLT